MIKKITKFLRSLPNYTLTITVLVVIIAFTLLPLPKAAEQMPLFVGADKVVHFLMFGSLSAIWMLERGVRINEGEYRRVRSGASGAPGISVAAYITIALVSSLIGSLIEVIQDAMPYGRAFDLADMAADWAGAFVLPLMAMPLILAILRDGYNPEVKLKPVASREEVPTMIHDLYLRSFPAEERREWADILNKIDDKSMTMYTITSGNEVVGFITIWDFDKFAYIEHFAVSELCRGRGIGSAALSRIISATERSLLLEAEPADVSPLARRRIAFYERTGFELQDYPYIQPPYSPWLKPVKLRLMTYGPKLDLGEATSLLKKRVYNQG